MLLGRRDGYTTLSQGFRGAGILGPSSNVQTGEPQTFFPRPRETTRDHCWNWVHLLSLVEPALSWQPLA